MNSQYRKACDVIRRDAWQWCRWSESLPFYLTLLLGLLLWSTVPADAAFLDTSQDSWAVVGGYGQSFPGWGMTTQRVETIDLAVRWNHHVFEDLGSGWYRGFHSTLVEPTIHVVVSPVVSTMIALNFLACYTFTANERLQPYIFAGGGPVYSFADIPGMGADFNGDYQGGIGLEYVQSAAHHLLLEIRFHHISNLGRRDPNEPLNSCKLMVGFTF